MHAVGSRCQDLGGLFMKSVVVTGGAGFIGSHVVEALIRRGYHVSVIDNFSTGHRDNISGLPVDIYTMDVRNPEVIDQIIAIRPEAIVHLAAQVSVAQSVRNILLDEQINVGGSLHVLKAAACLPVKKVVFSSTAAVYGNPLELPVTTDHPTQPESPYGLSKLTVENYLKMYQRLYQLPYSILRFSNVYGPRQDAKGEGGVVSIFADRLSHNLPPLIYGDGEQTRDFVFVRDVAAACVRALEADDNLCVNVSSGSSITINQLFRIMKEVSGSEVSPTYRQARPGDIRDSTLSNEAARKRLGWSPKVSLFEGLLETVHYFSREMTKLY